MAKKNFSRWHFRGGWPGNWYLFFDLLDNGKMRIVVKQIDQNGQSTTRHYFMIPSAELAKLHAELTKLHSPKAIRRTTMADVKANVLKKEPQATKAYEPWTGDQDKKLRDMHAQGSSVDAMAAALNRGVGAIESRLKKLGLKP